MANIGYACINMTLAEQNVFTGRTMRYATLKAKGLGYASELALQNCKDLLTILKWNVENEIYLFRMGSDIFPWGNKINVFEYPDIKEIQKVLEECGDFARQNGIRITTHPGPFNLLASPKPEVVENTIKDLEMHALIFDFMRLSRTHYNKINIHVGATYGNKEVAAATWCSNFQRLSDGVKSRLTIENDDKAKMFSVLDLYDLIYKKTGTPIVFDYHHHTFCTGGLTEYEALKLATSTWPEGITPTVHYSESKSLHENNDKLNPRAHSNFVVNAINTYDLDVDIMIEAKAKELALLQYRKLHNQIFINK